METEQIQIPNRLRKYREMKGYEQMEVAQLLGFTGTSRLSKWENGTALPGIKNLMRLSVLYNTLINEFYFDLQEEVKKELQFNKGHKMLNERTKTLGICLGTRNIGVAVLRNKALLNWRMLNFMDPWSPQKLHRMIDAVKRFVQKNGISTIAVKVPREESVTDEMKKIIAQLRIYCESEHIDIFIVSIDELKENYSVSRTDHSETFNENVVQKYPELYYKYNRADGERRNYFIRIIEAVAVGAMYS